jgi:hypothetical protein
VAESFLPWPHLVSLWAPDFFGNPTTGNYWGPGDYTHSALYSGLAVLILGFLAWRRIRQRKEVLFFALLLLISLALVLPTPLATVWRPGKIFGQGAIAMTRILFLVNFALAGLAACGFDFLVRSKNTVKGLLWTAGPILGLVIIFGKTLGEYQGWLPKEAGISLINLRVGMRNLFLPALVTFGTIVLLFLTILGGKLVRRAALGLIFLLTVGELFRFGWKYTPFVPSNLVFPETPVIRFLKSQPGIFRMEGGDAVPMNMLAAYGLSSFSAYDPMYPLRQAQFLALIDGGSPDSPKPRYGQISHYDSPLFDLANICYVLVVKRDNLERPDPQGNSINWRFKLAKFKPVFEDRSVVVLENSNCLPRAFLARHYIVEKTEKRMAERLQEKEFNPRRTVILEKDPGIALTGEIETEEVVKQTTWGPNKQELLVTVKRPALLFVSESDYPGWEAEIDGGKTEIFRADFAFRSVLVPAGEHKISFVYRPISFRTGLLVSGASLLFLLLAILRRLL